jgi:hypothetical protein
MLSQLLIVTDTVTSKEMIQNRDRVRLEAGAGSLTAFELAVEDESGEGELLFWQVELAAKKSSRRAGACSGVGTAQVEKPAPGNCHLPQAAFCGGVGFERSSILTKIEEPLQFSNSLPEELPQSPTRYECQSAASVIQMAASDTTVGSAPNLGKPTL